MTPDRVVEAVDVTTDRRLGLGSGLEHRAPDQFGLQGFEEGLDHRVVVANFLPGHRDPDAVLPQLCLILDRTVLTAAVGVMDQPLTGSSDRQSLAQRLQRQFLVQCSVPAFDGPDQV
jgi:hypothetical protein